MPSREEQTRTAPLGLRLQQLLKEELEVLARQHDRKLANYIELVLKDHVKASRDRKTHGTKRAS